MAETVDRRVVEIDVRTARGMQESMRRTADSVGKLEAGFSSLKGIVADFGAGLVAGLSLGAFVSSVKSSIDAMEKLGERSQSVGVTTEALSALTFQAEQTGIAAEQLDTGLTKLSSGLADMGKESTSATKALQRLGVVAGTSTEDALTQIAAAFQDIPDGAEKTALAVDIFGKSGAKLIPMLNEGAEGIAKFREEAERLGIVISEKDAQAAAELNDQLGALQKGVGGMITQLTIGLLPALLQIAEAFKGVTESGEGMRTMGEDIGGFLKFLTGSAINLGGAFQVLGRIIGGVGASMAAVMGGDFKLAIRIAQEAGRDIAEVVKETEARVAKLSQAVVVAPRTGGTGRLAAAGPTEAELKAQKKALDEVNKSWVQSIDLLIQAERAEGLAANAGKSMTEVLEDQQKRLDDITGRSAAKRLAEDFALLDDAIQAGTITFDEYAAGLRRITRATDTATDIATDQFLELGRAIQQSIEGWSGDAADAVLDFATGAEQDIGKMVEGILRQFAKLALQKLVFDQLFKAAGSFFAPAADGMAFAAGGQRLALAEGGVVTGPTPFKFAGGTGIMGEAGPEAILPLKRNSAGQLGVTGGGGDVTVNVINRAPGVEVGVERSTDSEREITVLIQQAVTDGFARGKFDGVMGSTYGINRRGR
jgi:hypothetical protein